MNKKLMIYFFLIVFLISLVSAAKVTQVDTFNKIELIYPQTEYIQTDQARNFYTHVYNGTGYLLTNSTVSCVIELYKKNGNHILIEQMNFDVTEDEFNYMVSADNLSYVGQLNYIFHCNTSSIGGFVSGSLRITSDGKDDTNFDNTSGISVTLFILFITLLLIILPFVKEFTKHEWSNNILKRGCWTIAVFFIMWNASTLSTIIDSANLDLISQFFRYMLMFGWAGYVMALYFVIASIFELVKHFKLNKSKKRYGDDD